MKSGLMEKNEFILALREHLMSLYGTKHHYTFGDGNYESVKDKGAYYLKRKDPSSQTDLSGFCFRKDLCFMGPSSIKELVKDVSSFISKNYGHENLIDKNSESLVFKLNNIEYLAISSIGKGYADEISLYITESPGSILRKNLLINYS